jgi:phosphate-selective porin OprO/OprP
VRVDEVADGEGRPGSHLYRDEDVHLKTFKGWVRFRLGGKINYDFGGIDADEELRGAFPGLDGFHEGFRRLRFSLAGEVKDIVEIKVEVDFTNVSDVKDDWFRFPSVPFLNHFIFGHMKEPFSLGMLTSSNYTTFMEVPLAVEAFGPFRNIGALGAWTMLEERMTAAAGIFLNTGSFSNDGQAKDQIDNANGANATMRVTGLPWYREEGRKLLHLGLSYSHRFRDEDEADPSSQFRARPESRLTDDRLVSTGRIHTERQDLVALETAGVYGPLSFEGEYFHTLAESASAGSLTFTGWYASAGWLITGEHREYDRKWGVAARVKPHRPFNPREGGWGAVELACRYSTLDLNDGDVRGGKGRNVTVGLNWYLRPKIRLMANYIHARVKDRAVPPIEDGRADIVMARFQLNF